MERHNIILKNLNMIKELSYIIISYDYYLSGKIEKILTNHTNEITSIVVLPSKNPKIISASKDNTLRLHDIDNNKSEIIPIGHSKYITSICIIEEKIATGSEDKTIRIWDLINNKCEHILSGHEKGVTCVIFIPPNKIAGSSNDFTIRIWNIEY